MPKLLLVLTILSLSLSAFAQESDIQGHWSQPAPGTSLGGIAALFGFTEDAIERADGPPVADFSGLPINEEALSRALSYDSAILGVPEHVCMRHPSTYSYWGPADLSIAAQLDENLDVVSYTIGGTFRRADRTIWMDGRQHPSEYAPHTWAGFTTGRWEKGTLITKTTHLKWGWIRRNGAVTSDQATVTTYYQRNDNVLTITWFVEDPHYLTDSYVKSADFVLAPREVTTATFGIEATDKTTENFEQCLPRAEIARPEKHYVPHYLPGENPFIGEWAETIGVPTEATLGGAETAYPEYRERLRK